MPIIVVRLRFTGVANWFGGNRCAARINHRIWLARDGGQEVSGVVPAAVDDDFEVYVAAGGVTGGPAQGDQLPLLNMLTNLGNQRGVVTVAGAHR